MTEPIAEAEAPPAPASFASRLARTLNGSERPWDPSNRLGLLVLCVVLIGVLGIVYPRFATVSNTFTILLNITAIGIAAFGSAMLVISGNVDLSIGGIYALVAVMTAIVGRDTQDPFLAIGFGILAGAALGYLNGRLVRALKINPLIVTLAMATILRGLAYVVTRCPVRLRLPGSVRGPRAQLASARCRCPCSSGLRVRRRQLRAAAHRGRAAHLRRRRQPAVSARLAGIRTERLRDVHRSPSTAPSSGWWLC